MRRALIAALFLTISSFASPARADRIEPVYEVLGHVTSVDAALGIYLPGIQVGMPVQAAVGPYLPDATRPTFGTGNLGMDVFVDGYGMCTSGPASGALLWVININLCQGSFAQFIGLDFLELMNAVGPLSLPDFLGLVGANPLTPPVTLKFYGLDIACAPGINCSHTDTPGFLAAIDSIQSVPDTGSTLGLMLVAVGAVILTNSRRHSRS